MPLFPESAYQLELPKMHRVLQKFDTTQLENVEETVRAEMHKKEIGSLVKPGMRIAMAVGSRGIQNLALIVKTVADELQKWEQCRLSFRLWDRMEEEPPRDRQRFWKAMELRKRQ